MGCVRALEERDIAPVVDLHGRAFALPDATAAVQPEARHSHFREMFLDAPWSRRQPSLVYEDGRGKLIGFLGVMSRTMSLHERPVDAVITAHFVVEPTHRATLAGIELLKALLAGPHDLTLADSAGNISRKLFEGLGGTTALLFSLSWMRLLRPAEFAAGRGSRGRRGLAGAWIPLSRLADAVGARWFNGSFRVRAATTPGEDLDGEALARCIAEFSTNRALRPKYDGRGATWLLGILARKQALGTLRKVLVRTPAGEIAGWYLYFANRGGIGEVIQVGAREGQMGDVLDHLFAHARREGVVALSGRIDPTCVDAFAARHCFFQHRGAWMLAHSRDPELIRAIQRGDAFLTRLEGELCMLF